MRLRDTIELIKCDLPDLTEGCFEVVIESDDGGAHVCVKIGDHGDGQAIMSYLWENYREVRCIVMLA